VYFFVVAPVISLPAQEEAEIGTIVRLECMAQGDPAPTVTLYRNGAKLQGQTAPVFSVLNFKD
jgi:hypothetical protein